MSVFPKPTREDLWLALLVALLTCAGCKNADPSSSSEVPTCTDLDGGHYTCLGCAVPAAQWADAGPLSCPRTIAAYCDQTHVPIPATTPPDCPPSDWGTLVASELAQGSPPLFYECDRFNLASPGWWCGTGTDVIFVYDKATGRNTAAVERRAGQQTCLAGPGAMDSLAFAGCVPFTCSPTDAGLCCHRADESIAEGGPCDFDAGQDQ